MVPALPPPLVRAIVRREDDQSVFIQAARPQGPEDLAHAPVQFLDSIAVGSPFALVHEIGGHVDRSMRHRMGEVEEERALLIGGDEVESLLGKAFGEEPLVHARVNLTAVLVDRQGWCFVVPAVCSRVHVVGIWDAEEVIEALVIRHQFVLCMAEVPFADARRRVAPFLEQFSDGSGRRGQPVFGKRHDDAFVHAKSLRIGSRQQRGTRRSTDRSGDIEVGQSQSLRRHPVQVRGLELLCAVTAGVGIPLIIGEDDDDVWPLAPIRICGPAVCRVAWDGRRRHAESDCLEKRTSCLNGLCNGTVLHLSALRELFEHQLPYLPALDLRATMSRIPPLPATIRRPLQ